MLEIGSLVDNKYRILSVIGRGGMSVVYLAINERANKTWAIKEVRKDGGNDSEIVRQNLIVETEMLKSFNHPYLPSIVDVIDEPDSFIIVMDYVEGKSLKSVLESSKNQPLEKENVLEWAKQLCDVLGYLHTRETPIIYRDMKPGNIMLKPDGTITLIDFGTAREYKQQRIEDTKNLGTIGYAAPEQYGGMGQTDARTDIYCLGTTLYHLLTGHSPAEPPYKIYPIGKWIQEYEGTGLEKIITKCTQQDPAARYQSCAELMYALEHVDEEDDAQRALRDRKWHGFLGACAICMVGIVGMVAFRMGWNSQIQASYDAYIDNAQNAKDRQTAVDYFTKAISMAPTQAEPYEMLLTLMDSDYQITNEESIQITSAIMHTEGGSKTSIDMLRDGNRRFYDRLVYRLGCDYYFFYDGADSRTKAAAWYEKVVDSRYLTPQQKKVAASLCKIGKYYASLGMSSEKYDFANQGSTYLDYWNDLVEITDGDLQEGTGHAYTALGLYKTMAVEIYNCTPQFRAAGITRKQLEEQLDNVNAGLENIMPEDQEDQAQIEKIEQNVRQARDMVKSAFAGEQHG